MMLYLLTKEKIIRKYEELENKNEGLEKKKQELEQELVKTKKEKEALERELRKYKNSNTPPSAHPHLKPTVSKTIDVKPHKRGAPKGHTGTNRSQKDTTNERHITAKECPNCHTDDFRIIGNQHQQQEEIPQNIQPEIVNIIRDVCKCNKCHLKFVARDNKTPLQGKFGINVMVLIIFLKFIVRGVLRKTAIFLDASFALKLAPASVQAIIERVAEAAEKEFDMLKGKIKKAKILYIDETSFSVLGNKWWVWVFRSDTDILFILRNSRGSKVLEEILGKRFKGIAVCDCWRAYDYLTGKRIQRCWSHLLRKSEELCKTISGRHFHEKLSALFDEIKQFNSKKHTKKQRLRKYNRMTTKLEKLVAYYKRYEECKSVVKYIDFHLESWFICIKFKGVEPTNNYAEQAIRETVMVRKIIGAFRSENGTKVYEKLASLLATWQFRQKDIKAELQHMLSANLC